MKTTHFLLVLLIFIQGVSCKSRLKEISCDNPGVEFSASNTEDLEKIKEAKFSIEHVSLKAKVTQSDGQNEQSFQLNLRMIEDSVIWASLSALGIEGARILIDKDSFQMMDRLNKTYYKTGLAYIEQLIGQNLDLIEIQDLLVGNPNDRLLRGKSGDGNMLVYHGGNYLLRGGFNSCWRLWKYEVTGNTADQKIDVNYGKYLKIKKRGVLPGTIRIQASDGEKKLDIFIEYQSLSQETIENISFQIPARYERKL